MKSRLLQYLYSNMATSLVKNIADIFFFVSLWLPSGPILKFKALLVTRKCMEDAIAKRIAENQGLKNGKKSTYTYLGI